MSKLLVFTSLFPNKVKPDLGIFIKKRMFAYARRNGCEIEVVAPVPYYPDLKCLSRYQYYSQVPRYELMEGINVYHPRYPMIPKISMRIHGQLMYLGVKQFISELHKKKNFDLIDGHFIYPDGKAAVLLGELLNLPVVLSARGSDINEYLDYPKIKYQIAQTLHKSNHVISVCQALKEMMTRLGIESRKISVIPNGVDTGRFYPMDKYEAQKKLKIDSNQRIILSVGGLIPRKGHELTIQAIARMIQVRPESRLYIIGSGPEKHRLMSLIHELKLQSSVFLVGQVPNDELVHWYNAADVFCLATRSEGSPNVVMEALSCGCPVIASVSVTSPEPLGLSAMCSALRPPPLLQSTQKVSFPKSSNLKPSSFATVR